MKERKRREEKERDAGKDYWQENIQNGYLGKRVLRRIKRAKRERIREEKEN